jgi:hypothetical protein
VTVKRPGTTAMGAKRPELAEGLNRYRGNLQGRR